MSDGAGLAPSRTMAPQSVPTARFIEDVDKELAGGSAEDLIAKLNANYQTYLMIEQRLMQRRASLSGKLPEVQKTLDALLMLQQRHNAEEEVLFHFGLGSQVFAKARVKPRTKASLWLGAGVLLEYPLEEAIELLERNLSNCKANMETAKQDLDQIKDFKTTTEVNIARVYNHDLVNRRKGAKT